VYAFLNTVTAGSLLLETACCSYERLSRVQTDTEMEASYHRAMPQSYSGGTLDVTIPSNVFNGSTTDPGSGSTTANTVRTILTSASLAAQIAIAKTVDPNYQGPGFTMPDCHGLAASACESAVSAAATAAGATVPSFTEKVDLRLLDLSQPAGAVLVTAPAAASFGLPSTVALSENPNPKPLVLPAANPNETYPNHINRLRGLGWVGTATPVQLDRANGDPAYGADGVPCRNLLPAVPVAPNYPLTFYRNPTTFSGSSGGSVSSWDCRSGGASTNPLCEYDEYVFVHYTWETGRQYATVGKYDQACLDAWNAFLPVRDSLTPGKELHSGIPKDPAVITYLTGDGKSVKKDWEKFEYGPFTISSGGQSLTYVVHTYRNKKTFELRHGFDKVKFRTEINP
jgi:hypothetical protein